MESISNFISAMSWHLYRIATFRTGFYKLSDTTMTHLSFIGVYVLAGVVRSCLYESESIASTALSLTLSMGITYATLYGFTKSRTLFCASLGSDAAGDFIAMVLSSIGITDQYNKHEIDIALMALEFAWSAAAWIDFSKLPDEMKLRGYKVPSVEDSPITS